MSTTSNCDIKSSIFRNQNGVLSENIDSLSMFANEFMICSCLKLIKALLRAQQQNRSLAKDVFTLTHIEIFHLTIQRVFFLNFASHSVVLNYCLIYQ